jgi:hypothetical protein
MSIKYVLRENKLVEEANVYSANVQISASVGLEEIADRIVDQGTTVRKADVLAVLENAVQACDTMLLDGMRVNFGGLVDLFPRIKGSFDGPTDIYDPARHQVDVAAQPGSRVRRDFRENATVEQAEAKKPVPSLVAYGQTPAPAQAAHVTPGTIGTIAGYRLKIDEAQADEGIYFVSTTGTYTIKVASIQKNSARQLVFLVPALDEAADWYLEVRTRYTPEGELRTGRLDGILTVE